NVRDGLIEHLGKKGVMSKVFFNPVHLTKYYRQKFSAKLPVTEHVSKEVLSLPMYPGLTEEEIGYIASECQAFFEELK
ncbi:MAG: DegT/DnrJ/EryC1/StrS family aminotransferase, partial [Thermoproteota archaeon]